MLESILNAAATSTTSITLNHLLICTFASLVLGFGAAFIYMYKNTSYTKSFIVTLVLLPAIVQLVIMVVNGNLGTGVAVLGAFSLTRFRSIPGTAREISSIFFAMATGLATGMGYIGISFIFLIIIGVFSMILNTVRFGEPKRVSKQLKITIPENLNYYGLFNDLFKKYTNYSSLARVKTTNMGTLYELKYKIVLKNEEIEKNFIDEIRCRNGNLNVICGEIPDRKEEL